MDRKDLPDWLFKPTFEEIMECFKERRKEHKKNLNKKNKKEVGK